MSVVELVTLVVTVLLAFAWYLTYTAARLHRLHTRVEGTYAALDAQLVRRAEAVLEVANSGVVDPAGALILAGAATDSVEGGEADQTAREAIESDLTQAIRLVLYRDDEGDRTPDGEGVLAAWAGPPEDGTGTEDSDQAVGRAVAQRLVSSGQRVILARRFHNDAVIDVQRLRRNVLVRAFHLAGHTDVPRTVEFDDDPGAGG
ncbi:hypothetical protein KEM60_02524 [Austwickia sp. TVS 96-490-7B]|uniref:hypothetical protein n=1 Tax=Austwickia sp. TVS 96-490-7B TaxID=2830843 RepID=UPI001C55C236|nr:hypothetical protein [Austwickia sp. TVS 96-490-7B]MBW3086311.1 hypothetical protein [Austwickia sp. TVS 96-490-7B]